MPDPDPTAPRAAGAWGGRVLAVLLLVEALGAVVLGARATGALGLGWGLRGDGGPAASDRLVVLGLLLVLGLLVLALAAAVAGPEAGERRRRGALAVVTALQPPLLLGALAAGAPVLAAAGLLGLGLGVRALAAAPGGQRGLAGVLGPLAGAGALVLAAVVVPVTAARLLGVDGVTPFAQAVALTPLVGAAGVLALVLAVVAALLGRRDPAPGGGRPRRGAGGARRWAPVAGLVVLLALHAAWLAPRWAGGPQGAAAAGSGGAGLVVASLNAELGGADPAAVIRLVTDHDVDVLVVVELTPDLVDALDAAGLDAVLPEREVLPARGPAGSGVWSRLPLTALPAVAGTTNAAPRAVVEVAEGVRVDVLAAHPYPPIPGGVSAWAEDLRLLAAAATGPRAVPVAGAGAAPAATLVLGDLNATRDHAELRELLASAGLRDVADVAGGGWAPTWPVREGVPRFLELDHVLVGDAVAVDGVERVTVPGTDHQGLVATLRVGGGVLGATSVTGPLPPEG